MPWAPASVTNEGCGPGVVDDLQLRWFDQFLKGEETGVLDAPVTLFVMGAEEWRDYPDWPPPGSEPVRWFLHSGGRANSRFGDGTLSLDAPADEPPDLFTADPLAPHAEHRRALLLPQLRGPDGSGRPARGRGVQLRPRLHQRTAGGANGARSAT